MCRWSLCSGGKQCSHKCSQWLGGVGLVLQVTELTHLLVLISQHKGWERHWEGALGGRECSRKDMGCKRGWIEAWRWQYCITAVPPISYRLSKSQSAFLKSLVQIQVNTFRHWRLTPGTNALLPRGNLQDFPPPCRTQRALQQDGCTDG